jgi:type II secretion system protein G
MLYNFKNMIQLFKSVKQGNKEGFTIVELLVVIVIIGILAAITIVSFVNVQDKARFANMQSDIKSITKILELYKTDNGNYPNTLGQPGCTSNWCGWDQVNGDSFIPGVTPKYTAKLPQLPTANAANDTYLYQSDGTDYQIIRFRAAGLSQAEMTNNPMLLIGQGYDGLAWGLKTNAIWW